MKLQADLMAMYNDVGGEKSAAVFAKKKAQAIFDFVMTGIPMTLLINEPGAVAGGMTAGPVKAAGLGGLDKPVPGMGLAAAKPLLEAELIGIWSHGGANISAPVYAKKQSEAIYNYFSQTKIQTKDESSGPLPAPPPAGPVTGPMTGKGGTLTDSYGTGFSAAKPILEAELKRIWSQIKNPETVAKLAKEEAEAIHKFCIEGKIDTIGIITAPAAVAPPPAPPMGAYFPGAGTAVGVIS